MVVAHILTLSPGVTHGTLLQLYTGPMNNQHPTIFTEHLCTGYTNIEVNRTDSYDCVCHKKRQLEPMRVEGPFISSSLHCILQF